MAIPDYIPRKGVRITKPVADGPFTELIPPLTSVSQLVQIIRNEIGAIANFKQAAIVKRLPKTRSGKILRKNIRILADEGHTAIPSTIDDPAIIEEIKDVLQLRKIGVAFHT